MGSKAVRVLYLKGKGFSLTYSAIIVLLEIIMDIFPGYTLAFMAGAQALYKEKFVLGSTLLLITLTFTSLYLTLLFIVKKGLFQSFWLSFLISLVKVGVRASSVLF